MVYLLWMPIYLIGFIAFMTFVGVVFSLIAATTCAVLAKRRGLYVLRYALAGGIYSMMMLAPFFYLVLRLLDRKPPTGLVYFVYCVLVVVWIMGPIGSPFVLSYDPPDPELIAFFGIPAALNAVMLGSWLLWRILRGAPPESDDLLPPFGYILPFLLAPLGVSLFYTINRVL